MTRIKPEILLYWRTDPSWYTGDPMDVSSVKLTDKATPEAVKSFNLWKHKVEQR